MDEELLNVELEKARNGSIQLRLQGGAFDFSGVVSKDSLKSLRDEIDKLLDEQAGGKTTTEDMDKLVEVVKKKVKR